MAERRTASKTVSQTAATALTYHTYIPFYLTRIPDFRPASIRFRGFLRFFTVKQCRYTVVM